MTPKQAMYQNQANTIIKHLEKRNMSGYYFETAQAAVQAILNKIISDSTVAWGGSQTLSQIGLLDQLKNKPLTLFDRSLAKNHEETQQVYRAAFSANYYLMSTNAITLDGKLVNIDGNSNRVAALMYGPDCVIIVAGMNKVAVNEADALQRVKNFAAPANTVRLDCKTPCSKAGCCHDCLVEDCICCNTVITRNSRHTDRIHIYLIGEELGY